MSNHGTRLTTKTFKKFSGTVMLNLPELDDELAKDFGSNGDALALILGESLTRNNLEQKLIDLGKKQKSLPAEQPQPAPLPMSITINADLSPNIPSGLFLVGEGAEHRKMGMITLEKPDDGKLYATGKEVIRRREPEQMNGKSIQGHKLRKELKDKQVLNACIMDALLANPQLIPDEWKTGYTYFWGTIFRHADGRLYVGFLCWGGNQWSWDYSWLDYDWNDDDPAASLAS